MMPSKHSAVPEFEDASPDDAQIDVASSWRDQEPDVSTAGSMTSTLQMLEAQTQTVEMLDRGVQTEDAPTGGESTSKSDNSSLPSFLDKAVLAVQSEMSAVVEEFRALEPLNKASAYNPEQEDPKLLHVLSLSKHNIPTTQSEAVDSVPVSLDYHNAPDMSNSNNSKSPYAKLVVTSVSWNSTGQTVAASYGRYDITGWCDDKGALATWHMNRTSGDVAKPDRVVETDVCLMCCAYHPEQPAVIAGGTFNGDMYVWDLSKEEHPQVGKSDTLCEVRHQEPIVSICWQYSMTEANKYGNRSQAYRLVSLGADGAVLVWVWHKMAQPIFAYHLTWPAPNTDRRIMWGGTAMSFMASITATGLATSGGIGASQFIVGTEGGRIFKCNYDINSVAVKEFAKALANEDKIEPGCPIKDGSYKQHAGCVYGVHCCPHHKDLFLTAGFDGTIRLYHSLKAQPLLVLEPTLKKLKAIQWSPTRPLVFAAASEDGHVYMYDLLASQAVQMVLPCNALEGLPGFGGDHKLQAVNCLAFNAKRTELFAMGSGSGVMVWSLPDHLGKSRRGEAALLKRVAAADDVIEAMRGS